MTAHTSQPDACVSAAWRVHRKSSPPVLGHHVHGCLLCPVGGISPRAGLIDVKRTALKSHQRLEMLSKTGKLLLGDFRQLPVCPRLLHCLPQCPSLLKSLITPQFPSALFLSHSLSVGLKHWLFITPSPTLDVPALSLLYCFYVSLWYPSLSDYGSLSPRNWSPQRNTEAVRLMMRVFPACMHGCTHTYKHTIPLWWSFRQY